MVINRIKHLSCKKNKTKKTGKKQRKVYTKTSESAMNLAELAFMAYQPL